MSITHQTLIARTFINIRCIFSVSYSYSVACGQNQVSVNFQFRP